MAHCWLIQWMQVMAINNAWFIFYKVMAIITWFALVILTTIDCQISIQAITMVGLF